MECFYHEGRPAVGSCRSCLKGICRSCVADLGKGLACTGRCEQAVRDLLATLDLSIRYRGVSGGMLVAARNLWLGLAVVALGVGAFVTLWGASLPAFREVSLLGVAFLAIGLLTLRVARRVRAGEPRAEPPRSATA
jgi:hypothetical protein